MSVHAVVTKPPTKMSAGVAYSSTGHLRVRCRNPPKGGARSSLNDLASQKSPIGKPTKKPEDDDVQTIAQVPETYSPWSQSSPNKKSVPMEEKKES